MKISGILFDLDGTLINTWDLYIEVYRMLLQPYVRKALTPMDIANSKPTPEHQFIELTIPSKEREHAYKRFLSHYAHFYDTLSKGKYPGITEMLERIRNAHYAMGIVTGKSKPAWEITSRKEEFGPFDVVITDSDVKHYKPHGEGLKKACDALSLDQSEVLYIGDNLMDYHVACEAGTQFAASCWAKAAEEKKDFLEEARRIGVRHFLHQPDELFQILE